MRILIADDETALLHALQVIFERQHYTVDTAEDGETALQLLEERAYDAAVLDVMMPRRSGLEVLSAVRAGGISTPILILTARSAVCDRVDGLDQGADDYLVKPFATQELLARVRALQRRPGVCAPQVLRYGDLQLDLRKGMLESKGVGIALNNKELQVMELLMRNHDIVLSPAKFIERIWEEDTDVSLVWANIATIRKKLAQLDASVTICSRRGIGYVLEQRSC
ncbi:MAG: response regulator transcription factor [Aristaeellaceae bacterium]